MKIIHIKYIQISPPHIWIYIYICIYIYIIYVYIYILYIIYMYVYIYIFGSVDQLVPGTDLDLPRRPPSLGSTERERSGSLRPQKGPAKGHRNLCSKGRAGTRVGEANLGKRCDVGWETMEVMEH
jgi:hypothetical protein